ncbi:uncharacterized protein TrAtP1_009096 [Trichoderma atroviride]|uniref:uncharacterized protein n=1 Tax=Hypocrea atroviridis TaxID=63577 RepID=UPI00333193DE|nr:hypothetical protein TrAtP1_009096 [Trichoderma atroviride]
MGCRLEVDTNRQSELAGGGMQVPLQRSMTSNDTAASTILSLSSGGRAWLHRHAMETRRQRLETSARPSIDWTGVGCNSSYSVPTRQANRRETCPRARHMPASSLYLYLCLYLRHACAAEGLAHKAVEGRPAPFG